MTMILNWYIYQIAKWFSLWYLVCWVSDVWKQTQLALPMFEKFSKVSFEPPTNISEMLMMSWVWVIAYQIFLWVRWGRLVGRYFYRRVVLMHSSEQHFVIVFLITSCPIPVGHFKSRIKATSELRQSVMSSRALGVRRGTRRIFHKMGFITWTLHSSTQKQTLHKTECK